MNANEAYHYQDCDNPFCVVCRAKDPAPEPPPLPTTVGCDDPWCEPCNAENATA